MHYILCKGNLSNKIINFSWHLDLIKPLADAEKQEKKPVLEAIAKGHQVAPTKRIGLQGAYT